MIHIPLLRFRIAAAVIPLLLASAAFAQQEKKSEFTVFYLKHAQARDVAATLEVMLEKEPGSATTRIIPEQRTNALFVNAPEEVTTQIEQFLRILDAAPSEFDEIKIFTLERLDPPAAVEMLAALFGETVRIKADPRTNSLIAIGKKDDLAAIEAILLKLGESNEESNQTQIVAFELSHVSAEKAAGILKELNTEARLAFDESGNRLLVSCDARTLAQIEKSVKMLDTAEVQPAGRPVQLRLVWLVDEKLAGENASAPAGNIEKTLAVLEDRLGLINLKTAAQFLVTIDPESNSNEGGRPFTARGTAEFKDELLVDLDFEGVLTGQSAGRPVIELNIHARATQSQAARGGENPLAGMMGGRSRSTAELAGLNTKVAAPVGHTVVLGVTTIRSASSVFVLQILPTDEAPGTP